MILTKHEFSCSLPTLGRINALKNTQYIVLTNKNHEFIK